MLSLNVIDRPWAHTGPHLPSRAKAHLDFEALHIVKTDPLVALKGIGHLLVLDSVLTSPLPRADL